MTNELLDALLLIKKECIKHKGCKNCPMRNVYNNCGVTSIAPAGWDLKRKEVWF